MPPPARLTGDAGREREWEWEREGARKGLERSKGPVEDLDLVGRRVGEARARVLRAERREGVRGVLASERERWRVGVFGWEDIATVLESKLTETSFFNIQHVIGGRVDHVRFVFPFAAFVHSSLGSPPLKTSDLGGLVTRIKTKTGLRWAHGMKQNTCQCLITFDLTEKYLN